MFICTCIMVSYFSCWQLIFMASIVELINQKFNTKVRKVTTFSMRKTIIYEFINHKKVIVTHTNFQKPWKLMPMLECYCTQFKYSNKHLLFTLATELHGKVKSSINPYWNSLQLYLCQHASYILTAKFLCGILWYFFHLESFLHILCRLSFAEKNESF